MSSTRTSSTKSYCPSPVARLEPVMRPFSAGAFDRATRIENEAVRLVEDSIHSAA